VHLHLTTDRQAQLTGEHSGLRIEEGTARVVLERMALIIQPVRGVRQRHRDERAPSRAYLRARTLKRVTA